ncbi:EscU/YscU/HrcU family type III secretion system export apparatus switch protein [bacterium]|nr:EscU/YscU/HrcU family type III secretion system export apparatus switch protein [bacterium]MCI0606938.1 EscU/YscU/HrcU family type III secretion system export apparatus switch protein [bacterium]
MSDKTEDPTPKRMRESKKKGQVAKSQDVTTAFLFVVAFSILIAIGPGMTEKLKILMKQYFEIAVTPELRPDAYSTLGTELIFTMLGLVLPLMAANFVIAAFVCYIQVGSLFTMDTLKPDMKKLNPLSKLKQWFSPTILVELLKNIVKMTAVCFLAYQIVSTSLRGLVLSVGSDISNLGALLSDMVTSFTFRVAAVFMVIAAADFAFQKKQHMKGLKMSKDEVKREYKEDEGDPHFKSKRKHLMQELVFNTQMSKVKKATVVVVNPTRIAVALFYDKEKGGAPEIVAKGERLIADQIRELAKEAGVPIMRNVSLAQALNRLEIGDQVPEELYEAVAEVLNFVYKMGQHQRR